MIKEIDHLLKFIRFWKFREHLKRKATEIIFEKFEFYRTKMEENLYIF